MIRPKRQAAINATQKLYGDELYDDEDNEESNDGNSSESEEDAQFSENEIDEVDDDANESDVVETSDQSDDDTHEASEPHSMLVSKNEEVWSQVPPNVRQTLSNNVMHGKSGPTSEARRKITSISDAFHLFVTKDIVEAIVKHTNAEGVKTRDNWKLTSYVEIETFIGLSILAGVFRSNHESLMSLWDTEMGRPIFRKTMSLERFKQLNAMLRFDDKETRSFRRRNDKFAPIRDVFDIFVKQLPKYYKPCHSVTIDEQLVSFRGRCAFKQYMPMKPSKYGVKFFAMCCNDTSFVCGIKPYLGKEGNEVAKNLAQTVVQELIVPLINSGRNITTDNFYTSLPLARDLKRKGFSSVGTIRKNRREIPPAALETKGRPIGSSFFYYKPEATLVSFKPKKNKVKGITSFVSLFKNLRIYQVVLLLSTQHTGEGKVDEETNKPEIILYYNSTKGAVDTMDQLASTYTVRRKTRRWPMCVFGNILDLAGKQILFVADRINWKLFCCLAVTSRTKQLCSVCST
jgi:hypothetical protein